MRRGEIASLLWELVDLKKRVLVLPITKNGGSRTVPLSSRAAELFGAIPRRMDGRIFGLVRNAQFSMLTPFSFVFCPIEPSEIGRGSLPARSGGRGTTT